jgi:hypothetical protein
MYIPNKFKYQLSFNWHLNLIEVCATQSWLLVQTKDCKTVLVALEGEVYVDNGTVIDPEGGVGLIRIGDDITYKVLNFRHFNTR